MKRLITRTRRLAKQILGIDPWCSSQIHCNKKRLGTECNGWWFCPDRITPSSVIYSFGVGEDASFDLALIESFGVDVHGFDPTPKSIRWVRENVTTPKFIMHEHGLADFGGVLRMYPPADERHVSHSIVRISDRSPVDLPVQRLRTIMDRLGHQAIDLLKMDIEGTEYSVIDDILRENIPVAQLLIEFHHRLSGFCPKTTIDAVKKLNASGYMIFSVSDTGQEYSFLKCTS